MLQPDLFYVAPDGSHQDDWIMEELLGADDVDEGEYASVVEEPRTLGEGPGHPFRGNQYEDGALEPLKKLGTTTNMGETGFILPSGIQIKKTFAQDHEEIAKKAGLSIAKVLEHGGIRVTISGIETQKVPTEAQAKIIADHFRYGRRGGYPMHLDVWASDGKYWAASTEIPNDRISADLIRNYVKAHAGETPQVR